WAVRGMPGRVGKAPGDTLEIGKHAVAPFLVQAGERGGKEMIIGHGAKISVRVLLNDRETADPRWIEGASSPYHQHLRPSSWRQGRPALRGRDRPPGEPGVGRWGRERAGRRALANASASAKQIGMRPGASMRVKHSKSQQIVANADDNASPESWGS